MQFKKLQMVERVCLTKHDPICLPPTLLQQRSRSAPVSTFHLTPQLPSNKYRLTACRINHFRNYKFFFFFLGGAPWVNWLQCKYSSYLLPSYLGRCRTILGCFRHLLLRLKSLLTVRRALAKSWLLLVSRCL